MLTRLASVVSSLLFVAVFHSIAYSQSTFTVKGRVVLINNVELTAREPGVIEAILKREGEPVKKGEVLVELDRELSELELQVARSEHEVAAETAKSDVDSRYSEKSQQVSEAVYQRAQKAQNAFAKSITQTEIEKLRLENQRDQLSLEKAKHDEVIAKLQAVLKENQVKLAQKMVDRRTIVAPFDGVIAEVRGQVGGWAPSGVSIIRLIRLDRLRVRAEVKADQYDQTLEGSKAIFTVKFPRQKEPRKYEGVISYVSPEIEPITNVILVWMDVDNPDGLLHPGQSGELTIEPKAE